MPDDNRQDRHEADNDTETGAKGHIYAIQKHDASTLHYDLRLQTGDTLASWAVPKGPSTDPADKRLAIRVEDHPVDYAEFEGVIPEDDYGGGTVMLWDRGTYRDLKDKPLAEALEEGRAEVCLEGEKLHGGYALIKMKGRGKDNWLLIKMDDEHARRKTDITREAPDSVATGRSIEDIADEER